MSRVVVVGGGVTGLCAAHFLRQSGFDVVVLDDRPAGHLGTSSGNAGMVVPSHFVPLAAPGMVGLGLRMMLRRGGPFGLKLGTSAKSWAFAWRFARNANARNVDRSARLLLELNCASKRLYEQFANGAEFGYAETGLLMICNTRKALEHERALLTTARSMGLDANEIAADELEALDPGISPSVAGAVRFGDDAQLDPGAFVAMMRDLVARAGVDVHSGWPVREFALSDGRVRSVRGSKGEIQGDHFVLTAGCWSERVVSSLNVRMPLLPGKGYSQIVSRSLDSQLPKIPAILVEARVAISPLDRGVRISGTMELGAWDSQVDRARLQGIASAVQTYYRDFNMHPDFEGAWVGHRPCTPDGVPYLGRFNGIENLVVATGGAMMGMSLGPILGKLASQLTVGEDAGFDLEPLAPDRFA